MRRANKVRAKLDAGQPVFGTAIYSNSPPMVAAAGYAGLDFVRIDTEHVWRQDDSLENMINAAVIAGVEAIVRVDRDNPFLVRKALELGAGGIIVPNITRVEEVHAFVAAGKFPPLGTRGIGPLSASGEWGARELGEWMAWSNREPLLGVMIEQADAMAQIDAILATPGLDFASFGRLDFFASLTGGSDSERWAQVDQAFEHTLRAAARAGKQVMAATSVHGDDAANALQAGARMVCISHDVVLVREALARKIQELQPGAQAFA